MINGATFQLDRASAVPLHEQLTRLLRGKIASGEWRAGDALPSIRELADAAGVAVITARHALSGLAAEGLTTIRRHVGSVVADGIGPAYFHKRVVLFSQWHYFPYYYSQLLGEIRMRLARDGSGVLTSVASRYRGCDDFPQLEEQLRERCDLIVEIGYDRVSRKIVEASGRPFVVVGDAWRTIASKSPNCVGVVDVRNKLGVLDFVHDCIAKGVKSVLEFTTIPHPMDAPEQLAVAEIGAERIELGPQVSPSGVAHAALAAMRKWLADHGGRLPDVIFFDDDNIAQGGLCALSDAGVRIPGDVAVVAHATKGLGPVWVKPLTRLEMDPNRHGVAVANAISGYLAGQPFPKDFVIGSVYRRGETF
jgi:DNA-binding LacI/PurR family transcriptional regulator